MKSKTGDQRDNAKFSLDISTSTDSKSICELGNQSGQSERSVKVTELPTTIDMAQLALELEKLAIEMRRYPNAAASAELPAIESAKASVLAGDRVKAGQYLLTAGKWALELATKVGVPVATQALKSLLFR